ncbi:MAG: cytochrome P450 [Armatimonadota bacterium]|nr:cytochrome P450 [Armatimonadota bacterium]
MPLPSIHQLWQAALAEEHAIKQDLTNLREKIDKRFETMLANPKLVRELFDFTREHDPILIAPRLAVVSRAPDVREVLEQDSVFSVREIYAAKMESTTGDFVLGMDTATAQYETERSLMQQILRPDDLETIDALVRETAEELVAKAAPQGEMDIVSDLTRVVPARLVAKFFGTPGPDEAKLMRWMRAIFRDIFLNLGNDPGMHAEGEAAAKELNAYLDDLIATRKPQIAGHPGRYDDYLSRLIKVQQADPTRVDDETIRRILGGTIVGTVDTNSKAVAQAIDQLLARPDALASAQEAAQADDITDVAPYVWEALRFNPQNPFLIRHCERDYTIADGTPRARKIPAGSLVLAGTMSAMFDPDAVPEPDTFRTDRPAGAYMHFGDGPHQCFGRHMAGRLIPRVAQALLRRPGLRRAGGAEGHLRYDGAFPDGLNVTFEATP